MKKFNLILAVLLVLSVSAFAVDFAPSVAFSGSASAAVQYDLDASAIDFTNSASATIDITLVNGSPVDGDGEVVGVIALSLKATAEETDTYKISAGVSSAKINLMGSALYLDIMAKDIAVDFAGEPDFSVLDGSEGVTDVNTDTTDSGSLGVVYTADAFGVTVYVADADDLAGNDFNVGFTFDLTAVEGLTFGAGVAYGMDGTLGYGAKVGYDLGVANVNVAYDGNDGATQILATVGVDVGATVNVTFGTDTTTNDLIVALSSGTLVEAASLGVVFEMANLETFGVKVNVSASVDPLSPYVEFSMIQDGAMGLKIGTGIAVIENTSFDVNYATADLGNVNGAVTFTAKVAY